MIELSFKGSANRVHSPHFLRYLFIPLLLLSVIGCGDNEQAQRQAFIDFLQSKILSSETVQAPELTQAQRSKFGHYVNDYAVITDFHIKMDNELNSSLVPVFTSMNALTSVNALLVQRDDLQKMAQTSQQWLDEFKILHQQADARHDALKQPDALKKPYDQAYNKVVSQPAAVAEKIYTLLPEVLHQIVVKADFIKSQGNKVTISGSTLQFSSQAQLNQYNAIQKKLVPLNAQLMTLSQQMQKMAN